METQQQKYLGKGIDNNNVWIDYDKKTVKFNPVLKQPVRKYFVNFLLLNLFITLYGGLILVTVGILAGELLYPQYAKVISDYNMIFLAIPVLSSLVFSLFMGIKFLNKDWRTNMFPKWNAMMHSWGRRYWRISKYQTKKNMIIIPMFRNIELRYKATKDYAEYLKKIEITNIWHKDDTEFQCVFYFKKKPEKGYLDLCYS